MIPGDKEGLSFQRDSRNGTEHKAQSLAHNLSRFREKAPSVWIPDSPLDHQVPEYRTWGTMKESVTWPCQVSYILGILPREASLYISASFFMQLKLTDKHGPQRAIMKFLSGERQNFRTVSSFSFSFVLSTLPSNLFPWKNSGENIKFRVVQHSFHPLRVKFKFSNPENTYPLYVTLESW